MAQQPEKKRTQQQNSPRPGQRRGPGGRHGWMMAEPEKAKKLTNKNAYLWKIAYNHLADFIKTKQKRPLTINIDNEFEAEDKSIENFHSKTYQQRIENLLKCIKINVKNLDFDIIKMSILEEKNSNELSEILDLKPATIRKRLSRSLKKVKVECRKLWQN